MDLVARAAVVIGAPRRTVWGALMAPETIPRIMLVSTVIAPWALGERFVWTFTLGGKGSRVEGYVHRVEDGELLEYDFGDPHSRDVLGVDNVHRVVIALADDAGKTRVSVTQDANLSEAARAHAEGGWRLALNNLKGLVEREALVGSSPRLGA
ncbi:MAG: SRPBCC domain-containing protein [Labilithrix sp.]|nr:SRPBCC domain-containing protein [Labilithrix sp.]